MSDCFILLWLPLHWRFCKQFIYRYCEAKPSKTLIIVDSLFLSCQFVASCTRSLTITIAAVIVTDITQAVAWAPVTQVLWITVDYTKQVNNNRRCSLHYAKQTLEWILNSKSTCFSILISNQLLLLRSYLSIQRAQHTPQLAATTTTTIISIRVTLWAQSDMEMDSRWSNCNRIQCNNKATRNLL